LNPVGLSTPLPEMLRCAVYRLLVVLHLLGATVWVGGHLVLSLVVLPRALAARDPSIVREFESGYERIGLPALLLQALTGVWLALHWVPDMATWLAPASLHGWLIVVKLGLLAATPKSDISIACWEPGQTSPIHHHPGADEIYHVIEGSGVFNDGRIERRLGPGDTVIFAAGEVHQVTALTRMVLYRVQAGADRHP